MVIRLSNKISANNPISFTDSAPAYPLNGDQWIDPASGIRYTYYTDSDTSQWVQFDAAQPYSPVTNNIIQGVTTGKSIAMSIVFGG